MMNTRFQFVRAFICSALLLILSNWGSAWGAYASPPSLHSPLKMPRYEQWIKLSPEAQEEFIQDVQAFLVRMDETAHSGETVQNQNDAQVIQRLFDLWVETAQAKPRSRSRTTQQPYCINQGVVKPLSECDTSLGYKMHNFDTNEILSKLGPASKCPSGEKPCSPVFGFSAEGQMFCSSLNLTRDCAKKSSQPGTVTLASTMMACDQGSPGVAKVDCQALKQFFNQQMETVEKLCQKAPQRFACGILKAQIKTVTSEKSEKSAAVTAVGADNVAAITAAVNNLAQMENSAKPCPAEAPAQKSAEQPKAKPQTKPQAQPKPAADAAHKPTAAGCVQKPFPKEAEAPTLDVLWDKITEGADNSFVCGEMALPQQGKLKFDAKKAEVTIQASSKSTPIAFDQFDFGVLEFASNYLSKKMNVAPKDLLASYLPKESLKDAGALRDQPSEGWVSIDGTRIRYSVDEKSKTLFLGIKRPGSEVEVVKELTSKSDQNETPTESPKDSKEERAAAPQPK